MKGDGSERLFVILTLFLHGAPAMAAPQLANPASVFCEDHGGRLEIRSDETAGGDEFGICIFADGSECGEWQFYRGDCAPGEAAETRNPVTIYCEKHGGTAKIRTSQNGLEQRLCIFADQSWCSQWDFYRNKCKQGYQQQEQSSDKDRS